MRGEKARLEALTSKCRVSESVNEDKVQTDQRLKLEYNSSQVLAIVFPAVYVLALAIFCIVYKVFPGPEFIVLIFLVYAAYNKHTRRFVKDWAPFVLLFLSYEAMDGLVGSVSRSIVNVAGPMHVEMSLFGAIPSLVLQETIRCRFLDYMGAAFYSLHFIAPTVFAFVLWRYSLKNFWKYTFALGLCTYAALVTFLVYPVAPPWIAVPGVTRVLYNVDSDVGVPFFRTIFDFVSSNAYAAFPSLHSAYPWLISLFALKIKKKKALPILVFPIGVWFSAVYLGEHYIIDVIGGIAYATVSFLFIEMFVPRLLSRYPSLRRYVPRTDGQEQANVALKADPSLLEPRVLWNISVHPYVCVDSILQVYSLKPHCSLV